ncbi:PEP-utilizing enzyme [Geodermatophilus sp. SYSU D00697]
MTGRARVLRDGSDLGPAAGDDVLVARHATPALLPALLRARAVVCETGGLFSHMAVLARELDKPCVVGCSGIVDAVQGGTLLDVDGTAGTVRSATASPRAASAAGDREPDGWVRVLQFGRFTPTFRRVDDTVVLDTVVRISALLSVPAAFGLGNPLTASVADGVVLVEARALERLVSALSTAIERGEIAPSALLARYDRGLAWPGWTSQALLLPCIDSAVHQYVQLNQLTWAAALVRERIGQRYEALLDARVPSLGAEDRRALFLDTLTGPGSSYIVDTWTRPGGTPTPWSAPLDLPERDRHGAVAGLLSRESRARRATALTRVRDLLPPDAVEEVTTWLARIDSLVALTERKNTDLTRCGLALFGPRTAGAAAAALGLGPADVAALGPGGDPEALWSAVTRVLDRLVDPCGRPATAAVGGPA